MIEQAQIIDKFEDVKIMSNFKAVLAKIRRNENILFILFFSILIAFRIWLITGIPKMISYGPHDDLYYAKIAHYIIHGQWMGPYNQMTLIKVPFYAFFMIFSFITGLPLLLSETIFYIGACILLFFAISPMIPNYWWRLFLFIPLLFCPASLATIWTLHVYREFVYFSLTLYVISFSIGLFLRVGQKVTKFLFWSIGLGLSMGAFMITREEGVWIYPVLFSLLLACLLFIWLKKKDQKIKRSLLVILPILIWYIPSLIVSYFNYSYYGFWGTTEQLDPDFNRVLSSLARIKTSSPWHPAIQVSQEARMKAYAVSPILNSMKDTIEASVISWNIWDDMAMASKPAWYLSQYGIGGTEISAHFLWLFRDAVASQGYYSNGKYPHGFYKQLADQLEAACNNGKLDCSPPKRIPLVGSIDQRYYPIILRMFYEGLDKLLNQDYARFASLDVKTWPVWPESYNEYKYFEEFVYNSLNGPGIPSDQDAQYLVNGNTDLRVKILIYKDQIIEKIDSIYKGFTSPIFWVGFVAWLVLLTLILSPKRRAIHESYIIVSVFMMGLLFSRLMTLAIVDATTSIAAIEVYGASNYVYIYIFTILMVYWLFKQVINVIQAKKNQL